jgi:hypothetical protein
MEVRMGTAINGRAINQVLADAVAAGHVPRVAAIVADRDGILYEGGAGVRIAGESDDPVTTSTQFRIMSMTKMVCTVETDLPDVDALDLVRSPPQHAADPARHHHRNSRVRSTRRHRP